LLATHQTILTHKNGPRVANFRVTCVGDTSFTPDKSLTSWRDFHCYGEKGKVFPYSFPSVDPELIPVYRQSVPAGDFTQSTRRQAAITFRQACSYLPSLVTEVHACKQLAKAVTRKRTMGKLRGKLASVEFGVNCMYSLNSREQFSS